jgi:hypothetical protein
MGKHPVAGQVERDAPIPVAQPRELGSPEVPARDRAVDEDDGRRVGWAFDGPGAVRVRREGPARIAPG